MIETEYKTAMVEEKTEYIITCKCDECRSGLHKVMYQYLHPEAKEVHNG